MAEEEETVQWNGRTNEWDSLAVVADDVDTEMKVLFGCTNT